MAEKVCKCVYKRKKRVFKPCDVVRIADNCVKDNQGVNSELIMALLAKHYGYKYIALRKIDKVRDEIERKEVSGLIGWLESTRDKIDQVLRNVGLDV